MVIAFAFMACNTAKTTSATSNATPEETAEENVPMGELSLTGTYAIKAIKGYVITDSDTSQVEFKDDKGTVSARMGCNTVSGTYSVSDNTVTFAANFIATRMYCEGQMGLEDAFSKSVPNTTCTVSSLGNEVIFIGPSGEEVLRLTKK